MKKYIYLSSLLYFLSCSNSEQKIYNIDSGFISEAGLYNVIGSNNFRKNVILKEFKDGSITFAIRDSKNEILFQQNINLTFNKYHYWCLYIDSNVNLWYYNSDYNLTNVVLFNDETDSYEEKDFCELKFNAPKEFLERLKEKSSLNDCKSLKD
jgi:hypothetical protein